MTTSLAAAFDGQAALFEKAPVQTDPAALRRLVALADFPADSLIFDAGCGPGLVSQAFLQAGHRVVGVDLSAEMIERARARCGPRGDRARFERRCDRVQRPGNRTTGRSRGTSCTMSSTRSRSSATRSS